MTSTAAAKTTTASPSWAARLGPARIAKLIDGVTLADVPHDKIAAQAPYTGEVLAEIPAGTEADVDLAVSRARAAQPAWAARSFGERARVFLRFHDLLLKRQDEVLDLIQLEIGKARRHAFEEVLDTVIVARYYAWRARRLLKPRHRKGALPGLTRTVEMRLPLGVVGFISPWNFPLTLGITDLLPALMAGNAVVLKPDRQTSLTALWAIALLREAGLPEHVAQVVTGEGRRLGPALCARVDFMMFTGSVESGKQIARQAAERLFGCSLELGGKNPMLVLRDADMDRTVEGAIRGCFPCAGQVCVSIERIYVDERVFDEFLRRFVERTRAMQIGPGFDFTSEMGSLASQAQLSTVEDHVRDALDKGATLAAGGRRRPDLGPYFYEPTILLNVREGMRVFREETFGPVVSVYRVATEDEAVERANDSSYGLSASIWSRDTARATRLARRIQTGSVNINEAYAAAWASVDSPIGGMKESGLRPRHGVEGLIKYTRSQTVAVQRLLPIAPPTWMDPALHARIMTRLLKLLRWTWILG